MFVVCVKNMRAILVNMNSVYIQAMNIAAGMGAFVYNQTSFSLFFCFMCKNGPEQASSHDEIIVCVAHNPVLYSKDN